MTEIKICGMTCKQDIKILNSLQVDYAGFVFVEGSKRSISPEKCKEIISDINPGIKLVALFVNGTDNEIGVALEHVDFDYIQLHGNEDIEKIEHVSRLFGKPIIKAVGVSDTFDREQINKYYGIVDKLLLDSTPKTNNQLPGGNGLSFNWELLRNVKFPMPWMLAGGLNHKNIETALSLVSPSCVDVSSGVEDYPGKKSAEKVTLFVKKVRGQNNGS